MIVNINCTIENVEKYEGKNGFGANITVSQLVNKKRSLLVFNVNSAELANNFEEHLQEEVELQLEIIQNNFGLRIGKVVSFTLLN
ncbi:TPA: hypothetical protein ACF2DJ_003461 [Clostridium perfringens]|uniref:hypothetical protein n=1 Tax=Clostridium perfringens TaxID=1502 RepID=UPI00364D05AB|nr:hypothetical protein [Serratia marcescens]